MSIKQKSSIGGRAGEDAILAAVGRGEFRIDETGFIWRISIRSSTGVRLLRPERARRAEHRVTAGYLQVAMMINGVRYIALAHRLVYRFFAGEIDQDKTINHLNGRKADNAPANLEQATPSQQALHARHVLRHGAIEIRGERHPNAKLTESQVADIRRRRAAGEELKSIGRAFGVSMQAISKIARGDLWAASLENAS